jgi:asparagine synthase (glutamine-hydrolysing)
VTVALSGDGADELLAGYDTYRASQLAPYYRGIPRLLRRGLIEPVVRRLPVSEQKYGWPTLLRRFVDGAGQTPPRDHCSWRRILTASLQQRLYSRSFLELSRPEDPLGWYAAALEGSPDWLSPLQQQMHIDLRFHLPNDILTKVDRMSMAHSLEVRVPLLDQEMIRCCLSLPPHCKRQGKRGKLALKEMLAGDLPADLIHRRKAGFLLPLERWMRQQWQPLLRETLDDSFLNESGMFQPAEVRRLLDLQARGRGDYAYVLFALLTFSLWWRIWIAQQQAPCLNQVSSAPTRVQHLQRFGEAV